MKLIHLITSPKHYYNALLHMITNLYRTFFYKGDIVFCAICNWKGSQFFDGKCPRCGSLQRTRLIPFSLNYFNLIRPDLHILHIAPNMHEYDFITHKMPSLSQYDRLNNRAVRYINIVQDMTQTDLANDTYELVICWHVLEHIPEDKKAIQEVYRLLKPGGHFLVSVPIFPMGNLKTYEDSNIAYQDNEKVHGHYDHCRSCGLDYYERFEAVGFKTKSLEVKTLTPNDIRTFGLRRDHVVWCFEK